jgi:hypothetical protein
LKGAALGTNQGEEKKDEVEVDINQFHEKERNKILNQRIRDKKKIKDEAEKDAEKAKEKESKKGDKSRKSKPFTPPLLLTETSYASPSQNLRKRDASTVQLSLSRLQQITSPTLMDSTGGALRVHEFFSGSLLSIDAYYVQHTAFPKEWVDMMAFLEKVFSFSCY